LAHGKRGEELAAEYLERLGFQILARNWRSTFTRNEIDIVAKDGDCIVFVEVKSARTRQFGEPLSWITPRKQAAIINAARAYMAQLEDPSTDFRFDAIAIAPSRTTGQPAIDHVCSAFTSDVTGE
jgi:putative endonuclease